MEQLRVVLATVRKYLGQLSPSQKLLIGSLVVIALMTLFLVSQYAGRADYVALLPGQPPADQAKARSVLEASAFKHTDKNGVVMVPVEQRVAALAMVGQAGKLPSDSSVLFKNILEKQSWAMSKQQNEQLYAIALQNELSEVISRFAGIESAKVIIDAPEPAGLGMIARRPTAMATVFPAGGKALDQSAVDAVASLIAGAKAGLDVDRVRVIDGTSGRQRRARSPQDDLPTTYIEHAKRVEDQTREKISELLAGVPGAVVAVTAQVDVSRVNARMVKHMPVNEGTIALTRKESGTTNVTSEASPAAEPGVRSNQTADINRGGSGGGAGSNQKTEDTEFENHVGTTTQDVVDPRGMPTMLAASIAIPRGYITEALKRAKAAAAPATGAAPAGAPAATEPTDQEIQAAFDKEKVGIEELVKPHVKTRSAEGQVTEGEVRVVLMPGDITLAGGRDGHASFLGSGGGGGSGTGGFLSVALGSGIVEKVALGVLALLSMGMMVSMVRKSSRKVELPSAEEIVGIPKQLETNSDLIGEADESEQAMTGIEVGDEEVKYKKMLEQVGDLVGESPENAARLMNRWMTPDS
jgi:flagellar biosynthesis/type III secretory pathway M-ring protein FliF/YscJ